MQNIHIMRNGPRIATSTINGGKKERRGGAYEGDKKEVGEV